MTPPPSRLQILQMPPLLLARAHYLKATNRSPLDLWSPAAVSVQRLDEQHVLCPTHPPSGASGPKSMHRTGQGAKVMAGTLPGQPRIVVTEDCYMLRVYLV